MTDHTSDKNRASRPFKEECGYCQENLEAQALGILEAADRARVERHLQWCGPCRRDLADIRDVVDLLALASEQVTPSPMVKAKLFQQIADEAVEDAAITFGTPWHAEARPEHTAHASSRPQIPARSFPLASALIAPLAIALIVLGAWANSLRSDLNDLQSQQDGRVTAQVTVDTPANQMRLYSMEPSCPDCDDTPASGQLGGNPDNNVGVLVAWNLNPNEQHHVWCEDRDGKQTLVSDLEVEHTGEVFQTVNFPEAIGGYSTIYVTRHDGTEEMRVALSEEIPTDVASPESDVPAGN
jgi:hypothetical protein